MLPEDGEIDEVAAKARAAAIEKKRMEEEQKKDAEAARALAAIAVKEEQERLKAEEIRQEAALKAQEEREKKEMAEARRKAKEESIEREIYMSAKESRLAAEADEKANAAKAAQMEAEQAERRQLYEEVKITKKKTKKPVDAKAKESEIYMDMQAMREEARQRRLAEEATLEANFAAQQAQAKKAEAAKKKAVKLARAKASSGPSLTETLKGLTGKEAGDPSKRPSRPPNEAAVIDWWKAEEGPRGVGRDAYDNLQPWFHGPISRVQAEALLKGQPVGAFLIRISTRIWGYTLSFMDADRPKHFLVDAAEGKYSVYGAQTRSHKDLNTLVSFHESIPVAKSGTKLTKAMGKAGGNEDSLAAYLEEMSL
jgi:SH2 domain-containing protein 4A